jgi:cysteinyl-tRNA synthetase
MHGAHLMVEGKKMAKSLGNFFTLRDLLGQGFSGREIRFLLLQAHYRETFNFTLDGLQRARVSLLRIDECVTKLRELAGSSTSGAAEHSPLLIRLAEALDDDLNISRAWGTLFDWVSEMNRQLVSHSLEPAAAAAALAAWNKADTVFGIGTSEETAVPAEITALVEARQAARKAKDFKRADALRDELKAKGWVIDDTPKGPRAKRL